MFHPLTASTLGYWDRTSLADLHRICALTGPRRGITPSEATHALLANIACAIALGNHMIIQAALGRAQPDQ